LNGFKVGYSKVPGNVEGPVKVAVVENPIERDSDVGGKPVDLKMVRLG
jgi:hypothetical protein